MKKRNAIFGVLFVIALGFGMSSCQTADSVDDITLDLDEKSESSVDGQGAGDPHKDRPGQD